MIIGLSSHYFIQTNSGVVVKKNHKVGICKFIILEEIMQISNEYFNSKHK